MSKNYNADIVQVNIKMLNMILKNKGKDHTKFNFQVAFKKQVLHYNYFSINL
jgi:hypothetical protein